MADKYRLARNWWIIIVGTAIFIGATLFSVWVITWPAIKAHRLDQPLPGNWTWIKIIAADMLFICLFGGLLMITLVEFLTTFTKEGVRRPRLFGQIFIRWADVIAVEGNNPSGDMIIIKISSSIQSIKINVLYYKNKDQLISLIREHVPSSTKWS